MRRTFLAVLVLGLLAPLLVAADEPAPDPLATVGVIDTGINPYHVRFRDDSPRAFEHPSSYIPGYPEDAQALNLTLDASSYQEAVATDRAVWESVQPDTLYWIPGTRIVGAKTDGSYGGQILDTDGHGTMAASRVAAGPVADSEAAEVYGACPDCLIVVLQGLNEDHVRWAGETGWIDAQTNSWGPLPVAGWADGTPLGTDSEDIEAAAQLHPTVFATGNGILAMAGVLGNPTITQNELTPSVIGVGGHDSGYVNTWPDFPPHVVSDSCDAWGAEHNSLEGEGPEVAGGTSGASPFAAGMSANM
ncbi:MAG: S8/S53 family peptidase, partial [Nitriliruptorales bacterium]|nr:S8/S53 family peptidase [Nitriliruptorales bacterium]